MDKFEALAILRDGVPCGHRTCGECADHPPFDDDCREEGKRGNCPFVKAFGVALTVLEET